MTDRRRKRPGSRLLLGAALLAGALGAMYAGAAAAELLLNLFGVTQKGWRLAVKAIAAAGALPAGFYAIERAFLAWSSRRSTSSRTPGP
jgi:hypothetical protein